MWRLALLTPILVAVLLAALPAAARPARAEPPNPEFIPYCFPPPTADLASYGVPPSEPLPQLPYPADAAGPLCDGRHLGFDKPLQAVPYCPNYPPPTPEEVAKLGRSPIIPGREAAAAQTCDGRHIGTRSPPDTPGQPSTQPAPVPADGARVPAPEVPAAEAGALPSGDSSGFPWVAVGLGVAAVVLVAATLSGRRLLHP